MRLIDKGLAEHGGHIHTLGDVIHNMQAVERLKSRGVKPVSNLDEVESGATLIIRAHGVHPDLLEEAQRRGIHLIDATCPFVGRSQGYVKQLSKKSYQVIIIGDSKHPEVISISGNAGDRAIIIDTPEAAREIDKLDRAGLVIQTTFSREKALAIIHELEKRIDNLLVYDTICQATELRREATLELASNVNLMLVVGGRASSNTKRLFRLCIDRGIPAKFIETAEEIDPGWFDQCERVGITTGTSTPDWVIDNVIRRMEEITKARNSGFE